MSDKKLPPHILALTKVESYKDAVFTFYDPRTMKGLSLSIDLEDFVHLGRPGYLRITVEVVDAEMAELAYARQQEGVTPE